MTDFQNRIAATEMPLSVAQLRIARDLHHAEAALDEALLRQAKLLATMVGARRETGVSPFTGQEALMRLIKTQQSTVEAGGELARVHSRLTAVAVETCGGNDKCPTAAELAGEAAAAAQAA
jgi:hypothetical protein